MQQQLVQFLAALSNGRTRHRFAEIAAGGDGVPARPRDDALLISAGVVEEADAGRVRVSEDGIRALLAQARAGVERRPEGKIDLLPRQRARRLELLRRLGAEILSTGERVPERELNDRLAAKVNDIPGVRRALVDEGILAREHDGSAYWRGPLA